MIVVCPMAIKHFPFKPGERVNIPGKKNTQGLVSFPANKDDAQVNEIGCLKGGDSNGEGRIIFVAWIADDGTRHRGYFTEAALAETNPA